MDTVEMASAPAAHTPHAPAASALPAPRTVQDTGLPFIFLVELTVKTLFLGGQLRLVELASRMKLTLSVIDPLIVYLRAEKLCEISRSGGTGTDADLSYRLTDLGRARGAEFLARCAYAGPAPVALDDYYAIVQAQSVSELHIGREAVHAHFDEVIVAPGILDQLGAAMNSGRAMFIHGPAGSGKTYLAERLSGLLAGDVHVPHAVYAGGEVIQVYDPVVHHPESAPPNGTDTFQRRSLADARWVRCRRPAVLTGGELTLDMLDLKFDHTTRYYQAPPHLKANNGIFIIDDLGRQRCSPTDLLNRWIVPMDRKIDFLALHTGYKFQVPFDVIVVFSSNLPPAELGDGAFLRRIGYKIHIGPLGEADYRSIFTSVCAGAGIAWDEDSFTWLLRERHARSGCPLLACYPRDLVGQVRDRAAYDGKPPVLTPRALDWAWNNYFTGVPLKPVSLTEGE